MNDGMVEHKAGGASSTWMSAMPSRIEAGVPSGAQPAHETTQARIYMRSAAEAAAPMSHIAITAKRRKELNDRFGTREKRAEAIDVLRRGRVAAAHAALSHSTWTQNASIMRFWFEFCELEGIDPTEFGVVPYDEHPRPSQLAWEDEKMSDFSLYVINNPRKAGVTHNIGNTAASYVSHVRTYYEFRLNPPRRVGGSGVSEVKDGLGHALRRCLKGLRKLYPSDPNHRKKAAVLYSHMIRLKGLLNLRDPFDAMIWAFVCVAWQGGRRSGELVRKRTGAWDPKFDMHRGRVTWDWKEDGTCARGRIALGPDKTDPTGEQGHTCFMPFSATAEINAAAAVAHMLALDPTPPDQYESTPLFRDIRGGWVWTWNVTARQNVRRINKIPFLVCTCPLHRG